MRDYLETFFRRKWLFFVPFLAVLAVAVVGGVYTSWVYEVQARLAVQSNPVLDQSGQQLSMPPATAQDEYTRLSALLQTDDFLKRVIDNVPALKAQADGPAQTAALVGALRTNLNAWSPAQDLITFRYRDRNPQIAQQVVSQTIDIFLAQRYQDRVGSANQAIAFLSQQQTDYQGQLQQASTALSTWENAHPPATRTQLEQSAQLEYQRLQTNYQTVLGHLQYIGGELEKARFTKAKMEAEQAQTYQVVDPPGRAAEPGALGQQAGRADPGWAGRGHRSRHQRDRHRDVVRRGAPCRHDDGPARLAEPDDGARRADRMTLMLPLLATFLIAGQIVRKWDARAIVVMLGWITILVGIHIFVLH